MREYIREFPGEKISRDQVTAFIQSLGFEDPSRVVRVTIEKGEVEIDSVEFFEGDVIHTITVREVAE